MGAFHAIRCRQKCTHRQCVLVSPWHAFRDCACGLLPSRDVDLLSPGSGVGDGGHEHSSTRLQLQVLLAREQVGSASSPVQQGKWRNRLENRQNLQAAARSPSSKGHPGLSFSTLSVRHHHCLLPLPLIPAPASAPAPARAHKPGTLTISTFDSQADFVRAQLKSAVAMHMHMYRLPGSHAMKIPKLISPAQCTPLGRYSSIQSSILAFIDRGEW